MLFVWFLLVVLCVSGILTISNIFAEGADWFQRVFATVMTLVYVFCVIGVTLWIK